MIFKRILGSIIVFAASYFLLLFFDSFGLDHDTCLFMGICLGLLFLLSGGSILKWIDEISGLKPEQKQFTVRAPGVSAKS